MRPKIRQCSGKYVRVRTALTCVPCSTGSTGGGVGWYSGTVQRYSTPVRYTGTVQQGTVHRYGTPVRYTGTVQRYSTPVQYSGTVQRYSTPVRYTGTVQRYSTPVHPPEARLSRVVGPAASSAVSGPGRRAPSERSTTCTLAPPKPNELMPTYPPVQGVLVETT